MARSRSGSRRLATNPTVVEVAIGTVSVAAWAGLYGLMLLATRPRAVPAAPATQDLGAEPPAVVSLVGQGWDLGEDAVEATLLDLGARKLFEFRQPANDPTHTTIHIRQPNSAGLSPYEQRVFDRVAGLAVGGVVPLTALTFRDSKKAKSWWKRVRSDIVADARSRGLSRRRFSPAIVGALVAAAAVAALGVGAAVLRHETRVDGDDPWGDAGSAAFAGFIVLSFVAGRSVGERDTPAGREVAARWLGVKSWLQGNEGFADQPPSAVAVWDRYLGYGAALGTTRVASAVIDLGMGSRKRVWSSYGEPGIGCGCATRGSVRSGGQPRRFWCSGHFSRGVWASSSCGGGVRWWTRSLASKTSPAARPARFST